MASCLCRHWLSVWNKWVLFVCDFVTFKSPFLCSLHRVSVLTWAVPIWRVWAESSARHSTSPLWRSESAAPRGTTLPRNPPDCQRTRNCWLSQRPSGILRSPWPDCSALSQPIRKPFAFYFLLEQPITNSSPEWGKLIGWLLDSLLIFFCVIIFLLLTFLVLYFLYFSFSSFFF